jgi:hypothetical protein
MSFLSYHIINQGIYSANTQLFNLKLTDLIAGLGSEYTRM